MDQNQFVELTRALRARPSRRLVLRALAGAGAGFAAWPPPESGRAKRKRKPPLRLNAFGCVDVGQPCRGSDANCCSGICQGKKPKKGEKDKSRCIAHDTGGCPAGYAPCSTPHVSCTTQAGADGFCATTTGNAGYCTTGTGGECFPCAKDADCREVCGPAAACIACQGCEGGGTCATTDECDFSVQREQATKTETTLT
jgi:hypothetical protein